MTDAGYADDQTLIANRSNRVETVAQAAGGFIVYRNALKTELMCFKQKAIIFAPSGCL